MKINLSKAFKRRTLIQSAGVAALGIATEKLVADGATTRLPKWVFSVKGQRLAEPSIRRSSNRVLDTRLRVRRTVNSVAGQVLPPSRTYEGRLTGPTFHIQPGDLLKIHLVNDLKTAAGDHLCGNQGHSMKHCQDHTNLHVHGLHVSPSGIADNILIDLQPGADFHYEIPVPLDHPPGLFWYHPHRHGTVANQVMEGMSGAIIISGGLDEVPEIAAARDQLLIFQQYMIPGGTIENMLPVTINGQLEPLIEALPGEVLRWRMLHTTTVDFINLELLDPEGNQLPLHVIAEDGLALGRIDSKESHSLSPGNRVEILVQFPHVGEYRLIHKGEAKGLRDFPTQDQLLARVSVSGPRVEMKLPTQNTLDGLAPFAEIRDDELTGRQPGLTFKGTSGDVTIDGKSFDPSRIDRKMRVGDVEEWTLRAATGSHPFHIHVNPFQVMKINGVALKKPIWRDVVLVRSDWPEGVTIRTRYLRFSGITVLHCHNLVHEDKGMMQLLELQPSV